MDDLLIEEEQLFQLQAQICSHIIPKKRCSFNETGPTLLVGKNKAVSGTESKSFVCPAEGVANQWCPKQDGVETSDAKYSPTEIHYFNVKPSKNNLKKSRLSIMQVYSADCMGRQIKNPIYQLRPPKSPAQLPVTGHVSFAIVSTFKPHNK